MRSFFIFAAVFLTSWAVAQDNDTSSSNPFAAYPTCAQNCLGKAFTDTQFCPDPSNSTCTCNDPDFNGFVTGCVLQSCPLKDALVTQNITVQLCQRPVEDRSSTLVRETAALLSTTCLLITGRILFKIFAQGQTLWWDDYLLVLLLIFGGAPEMIITIVVLVPNGIGRDFWTLSSDQITTMFEYNYIEATLYFPQVAALKCIFLFFFLRIFTARKTQRVIYGTMILTIVWGTASTFVGVFQCWPIPYYWVWDGSPGGTCMDKNDVQLANAVISIALDVWILVIPLWNIRKLNMSLSKKTGIAIMFMMGGFVTIVSCIRLKYLRDVITSSNPSQTLFDIIRWSTIEGNTSIYCACMPMMRQVLVRIFGGRPKTQGSNSKRSLYYRIFSSNKGSVPAGASSSGVSKQSQHGFWTMALESHQDNDEYDRSTEYLHRGSSPEAELGMAHGNNIMRTASYNVDYDTAQPETREHDIMMNTLGDRAVFADSQLPSRSYRVDAGRKREEGTGARAGTRDADEELG